ncbi:MAG: hypothetical protein EB830_00405 [Nitrosopumilus sp. H13]|nr:MAG: hypothetical protein EB830_00405 [Nitrosopumilus sp. H13]
MAKIAYCSKSLHKASRDLLDQMIGIAEDYDEKGYRLTVRQLYYQLVSRNIIPNNLSSYQRASKILLAGRMMGEVDWDVIMDRARTPIMPGEFRSMSNFVKAALNSYRKYRWEGQDHYVEVMVEKEALAGILERVTREYHVLLLANKGYSSASAIHDVAGRMEYEEENGKTCHVIYLGDHDPSGMDMVRDIDSRLNTFGCSPSVERLALTMDQIEQYNPPPNPAKSTDPRSRKYSEEFGGQSWELDALNPEILSDLLESRIQEYLDVGMYNDVIEQEDAEKGRLEKVAGRI